MSLEDKEIEIHTLLAISGLIMITEMLDSEDHDLCLVLLSENVSTVDISTDSIVLLVLTDGHRIIGYKNSEKEIMQIGVLYEDTAYTFHKNGYFFRVLSRVLENVTEYLNEKIEV
jgi:hypothetical protein